MEKSVLDRRCASWKTRASCSIPAWASARGGSPSPSYGVTTTPWCWPSARRDPGYLSVPGSDLDGVMPAMTFLEAANRAVNEGRESNLSAKGRHVVILGGGDTGADCLGTVHRQGAASIIQIEILDRPPDVRPTEEPWPTMARLFKVTSAHAEGGERRFSTETVEFRGDGLVESMVVIDRATDETSDATRGLGPHRGRICGTGTRPVRTRRRGARDAAGNAVASTTTGRSTPWGVTPRCLPAATPCADRA